MTFLTLFYSVLPTFKKILDSTFQLDYETSKRAEIFNNSRGILLLGETMSGKSFAIEQAIQDCAKKVNKVVIYPNALDDVDSFLFSKFDEVMGIWHDGFIPRFIRNAEVDKLNVLVLDGKLKSSWAENLNSFTG